MRSKPRLGSGSQFGPTHGCLCSTTTGPSPMHLPSYPIGVEPAEPQGACCRANLFKPVLCPGRAFGGPHRSHRHAERQSRINCPFTIPRLLRVWVADGPVWAKSRLPAWFVLLSARPDQISAANAEFSAPAGDQCGYGLRTRHFAPLIIWWSMRESIHFAPGFGHHKPAGGIIAFRTRR